jgi:hypothetical protein
MGGEAGADKGFNWLRDAVPKNGIAALEEIG